MRSGYHSTVIICVSNVIILCVYCAGSKKAIRVSTIVSSGRLSRSKPSSKQKGHSTSGVTITVGNHRNPPSRSPSPRPHTVMTMTDVSKVYVYVRLKEGGGALRGLAVKRGGSLRFKGGGGH